MDDRHFAILGQWHFFQMPHLIFKRDVYVAKLLYCFYFQTLTTIIFLMLTPAFLQKAGAGWLTQRFFFLSLLLGLGASQQAWAQAALITDDVVTLTTQPTSNPAQANRNFTGSNNNGLYALIYRDGIKTGDRFSNLKHNNYLPYLMGALAAKELKCNDAIILNSHGRVCDSCIANIFIIKDKQIFTPSLGEACVAGVMRGYLLKQLPVMGFDISETTITEQMLLDADEVFFTNSIYNMRWVSNVEDKQYG
ncbi:MAG: hypothetical protein EOO61_19870, partial [Hymenobacter sp.]